MTRPDGFPIADHDVGFLTDDRVLSAVDDVGATAVVGYLAVRDLSWARGERVTFAHAVRRLSPLYAVDPDTVLAALTAYGLLDADGRIPSATWASWYTPAANRRELRRELGRRGGLAKAARASLARAGTNGAGEVAPSHASSGATSVAAGPALPDRPSDDATSVASDGYGPIVAQGEGASVYCLDYQAHRNEHRRAYAGGPFLCGVCGPRPSPGFRARVAAAGGPDW